MAGHSKWANIKHRKSRVDAKRGKVFTKLVKEIMVAAKMCGSEPANNPRLRTAIDKAKSENLPADNIDRAIKKGAGELADVNYEEGTYEGYGPGGVAIMVNYMTDNKNRTASDVRHTFTKCHGNLGENGSVGYIFDLKGLITLDMDTTSEDELMESALDAGAQDIVVNEEERIYEVYTDPPSFLDIKETLIDAGFNLSLSEITMIPSSTIYVEGKVASQLVRLIDALEDLDDVQAVYANFEMSEQDMEGAL